MTQIDRGPQTMAACRYRRRGKRSVVPKEDSGSSPDVMCSEGSSFTTPVLNFSEDEPRYTEGASVLQGAEIEYHHEAVTPGEERAKAARRCRPQSRARP